MIRKFENSDIDDIMQIWQNENIRAHNFISKEYWKNNYEHVKKLMPNSEIYVYIEQGKVKGFIGINNNYIEGIFIDSDSQNKGVGTALLNKVKEEKMELRLNVYEKNIKAVKFYQKNGFEIVKETVDKENNEKEFRMMWNKGE